MSSCLSGGGRAYGLDIDIVKAAPSSSSSPRTSHTSSTTSSTLSESSNCPLAISTKKPRTQRKRPNQTYAEAAALLAKIYPGVFSAAGGAGRHCRHAGTRGGFAEAPELLPQFPALADAAGFLLRAPPEEPPGPVAVARAANCAVRCCRSPAGSSPPVDDDNDFDAESMLDEEVGEGIDSILGNLAVETSGEDGANYADRIDPYLGHNPGTMFGLTVTSALRRAGNADWWCSPTVEIGNIVPRPEPQAPPPQPPDKKKKKKKKKPPTAAAAKAEESVLKAGDAVSAASSPRPPATASAACLRPALSLNLNLDGVMKEWADGGSPFSEAPDSSESPTDIIAKLSDIDLFSETVGTSGIREASVLRYKEKRRSRLFSTKIRYEVRKANADIRPQTKSTGRFAKKDDDEL